MSPHETTESLPAAADSHQPCKDRTQKIMAFIKEFATEPHVLDFMHAVITAADALGKAVEAETRKDERERCAKIAEVGMPDQNNAQQRDMIRTLMPSMSESKISEMLNRTNRAMESCSEFIAAKIRSGE